jgi:Coenzyme PQQ synthesis protein D (PqqD)
MSDETPSLDQVYQRSDRMVGRRIADEFVLVRIVGRGADLDVIYSVSRVGAFIWEHLDGRHDGAAIVDEIVQHFDVDSQAAARDYRGFIAKLRSIKAIERA